MRWELDGSVASANAFIGPTEMNSAGAACVTTFHSPCQAFDSFVLLSPDFLPPESTRRRWFKKLTSHFSMIYVLFLSSKVSDPFECYDCCIIKVRQMAETRHFFLLMNLLKAQSLFQKLYL